MEKTSNMSRVFTWGGFIVFIGLIVWGMIAASSKAEKENASLAPVDAVTASDWVKGATSSPITLVEYSDFQCPACAAYFPLIEEVIQKDGARFTFVYRHFPLSQHANAIPASKAAEAAGKQGKFWEMHSLIFTNQKNWELSKDAKTIFQTYATELGLDMTKFNTDYDSKEIMEKINNDLKSGVKAGVSSTPTFYLNGKKINAQTYEQFKKLIDEASVVSI